MTRRIDDVPDSPNLVGAPAPLWSADNVEASLHLTPKQLVEARAAGTLLGVQSSEGMWAYPLFQFEKQGSDVRVKPALQTFFTPLRGHDGGSVAVLAVTPADELDGMSPVEWTRDGGDVDALLDLAHVVRTA